jgi:hypothetical protein
MGILAPWSGVADALHACSCASNEHQCTLNNHMTNRASCSRASNEHQCTLNNHMTNRTSGKTCEPLPVLVQELSEQVCSQRACVAPSNARMCPVPLQVMDCTVKCMRSPAPQNPATHVLRARFSAITAPEIRAAMVSVAQGCSLSGDNFDCMLCLCVTVDTNNS